MPRKSKKIVEPEPEPEPEPKPEPKLSNEEKYLKILEGNRLRQKKYYESHKKEIKEKAKKIYQMGASENKKQIEENGIWETDTFDSFDDIFQKLPKRHKHYESSLRTFFYNILDGPKSFVRSIKNYKRVLALLDKGTKTTKIGEVGYAVNSKKYYLQTLVVIITDLKLEKLIGEEAHTAYKNEFNSFKLQSHAYSKNKQLTQKVMDLGEFLEKIKKRFCEDSKQYVLFLLYSEATLRDNFKKLIMFNGSLKDFDDKINNKEDNYIIIPKTGVLSLQINKYKTVDRYG